MVSGKNGENGLSATLLALVGKSSELENAQIQSSEARTAKGSQLRLLPAFRSLRIIKLARVLQVKVSLSSNGQF